MVALNMIQVCQEVMGLVSGLFIIKGLIMREGRGRIANMNHSGHIRMYETDELEITRRGEHYAEGLARDHRRSADASRAVKGRRAEREPWTADEKRQVDLSDSEECDGVDLISVHCPIDRVTGMNPNLIWQEGNDLLCLVHALRPDRSLPSLGLD